MILTLGSNKTKAGLTGREKAKLKKEYVEWFPSDIIENNEKLDNLIDNLKDVTSSLFQELSSPVDSDDVVTVNQSLNKEQQDDSIPSLPSPKDKVTSSDDSPAKHDQILQDTINMKLPSTEFSILNNSSYPCSPDTVSHGVDENTSIKQAFSNSFLHRDDTNDTFVDVEELSEHGLNDIPDFDIDDHADQSLELHTPCSVDNLFLLLEEEEPVSERNPCDGLSKSELLLEDNALSNDGMDVLDPNPRRVSNSESLNEDMSFEFKEADNYSDEVMILRDTSSTECVSIEPIIENLDLPEGSTDALNRPIEKDERKAASFDSVKTSEAKNEENLSSIESVSSESDNLETTLKELEQCRRFFSIPKHPLSPIPPTPPNAKLEIESLGRTNSDCEEPTEQIARKRFKKSELVEKQFEINEFESKSSYLAGSPKQPNNIQVISNYTAKEHVDSNIYECQAEPLKEIKFVANEKSAIPLVKVCKYKTIENNGFETISNLPSTKKRKYSSDKPTVNTAPIRTRGRAKLTRGILGKPKVDTQNGEEIKEQFGNHKSNQALVLEDTTIREESSWVADHKPQKVRTEHRKNSAGLKISNFDVKVPADIAELEVNNGFDKAENIQDKKHSSPEVTVKEKSLDTVYNIETKKQINVKRFVPVEFVKAVNAEESTASDFVSTKNERTLPTCMEDIISSMRNIHPDKTESTNPDKTESTNPDKTESTNPDKTESEESTSSDFVSTRNKRTLPTCMEDIISSMRNIHPNKTQNVVKGDKPNVQYSQGKNSNKFVEKVIIKASGKDEYNMHMDNSTNIESSTNKRTLIPGTGIKYENKVVALDINEKHCPLLPQNSSQVKCSGQKLKKRGVAHKPNGKSTKQILKVQKAPKLDSVSISSKGKTFIPGGKADVNSNIQNLNKNKCLVLCTEKASSSTLHQKTLTQARLEQLRKRRIIQAEKRKLSKLQNFLDKKCHELSFTESNPIVNFFQGFQSDQLCDDNLKHIVQSLVKLFINPSSFPNKATLLFHVFNYLSITKTSPLVTCPSSGDQLPFEEKCLVVALFRIEFKKIPRLCELLKTAVSTLHDVILSKHFQANGLASLCRVFTEICKREGNSVEPVMLCAELLKMKRPFSPYLVASIAGVWKELFQIEENISVEQKLLHSSILYAAMKKPKELTKTKWNASINIISKNFSAPPLNDTKAAIHILKSFIHSKCRNDSWNSQYMTSALTIIAVYESWEWIKEHLLDNYILPNLSHFGKTELNEVVFNLYCNLYVDLCFVQPGKNSVGQELINIFNYPEMWQGEFVNDCVALALIRLNFLKNKPLPPFLSSWFENNHQKPKVQEMKAVFNRRLMLANKTVLQLEEIL